MYFLLSTNALGAIAQPEPQWMRFLCHPEYPSLLLLNSWKIPVNTPHGSDNLHGSLPLAPSAEFNIR